MKNRKAVKKPAPIKKKSLVNESNRVIEFYDDENKVRSAVTKDPQGRYYLVKGNTVDVLDPIEALGILGGIFEASDGFGSLVYNPTKVGQLLMVGWMTFRTAESERIGSLRMKLKALQIYPTEATQ